MSPSKVSSVETTESVQSSPVQKKHISQTNGLSVQNGTQVFSTSEITQNSSVHKSSKDQQTLLVSIMVKKIDSMLRLELKSQMPDPGTLTIESFLEYITIERLKQMPRPGSKWDRILNCAEYFGLQVSRFAKEASSFMQDCRLGASLAWSSCLYLLGLGQGQVHALDTAFTVLYNLAATLAFLLRQKKLIGDSTYIKQELVNLFGDMINLSANVAVHYHQKLQEISDGKVALDFIGLFGNIIASFYQRKDAIAEAMWNLELQRGGRAITVDVNSLRDWLGSSDRTSTSLASSLRATTSDREEYTCEWFQPHLADFARSGEELLSIVGPEGCGKSVLIDWIEQRFSQTLEGRSYETVSYSFDETTKDRTGMSFLKNIALQLLEHNIGDIEYYNALVELFETYGLGKSSHGLENGLWKALYLGFKTVSSNRINMMILLDGLDGLQGSEDGIRKFFQQIYELAVEYRGLKVILTGRPITLPSVKHGQSISITPKDISRDIQEVIRRRLDNHPIFSGLNSNEQESIVERVLANSRNSFTCSILLVDILWRQTSKEAFTSSVAAFPQGQSAAISQLLNSQKYKETGMLQILSWLVVAQQQFAIADIETLLQVDVEKITVAGKKVNIANEIHELCGSLVKTHGGIVKLRTRSIKEELTKFLQGKLPKSIQDANRDLTLRLLIFARYHVTTDREPSLEPLDFSTAAGYLNSNSLLRYTTTFWAEHFSRYSLTTTDGGIDLPSGFKNLFPNSTLFALLEQVCWSTYFDTADQLKWLSLGLNIRQSTFGDSQKCVLQSLLNLAYTQRELKMTSEAAQSFYKASFLIQTLFGKWHILAISCSTIFLTCTEKIKITSRTEIVTQREQMLRYMIGAYKNQHGATSELVIKYNKMLAQLYIEIKEEHLAMEIYQELHEIDEKRYGRSSQQAVAANRDLVTVLEKHSKQTGITSYTKSVFETRDIAIKTHDTQLTTAVAESWESRGDVRTAEEIYLKLLRRSNEESSTEKSIDYHGKRIDLALAYSKFLQRHKREGESGTVLVCLWNDYEKKIVEDEQIMLRFKTIGETMRTVGLTTTALTIFTHLSGWFKKTGKTNHKEASSINTLVHETSQDVLKRNIETSSQTTVTTWSETNLRRAYEMSITQSFTKSTLVICTNLITHYENQRDWKEAISVSQTTLRRMWQWILTGEGTGKLPDQYTFEAIHISYRLAFFYEQNEQYKEAEQVYVRIYRACKQTLSYKDERVTTASRNLTQFYEKRRQFDQLIDTYNEILIDYRRAVGGVADEYTVKLLYTLGDLCAIHRLKDSPGYYREVLASLNKNSNICHADAYKAATWLFNSYYDKSDLAELLSICSLLWNTFIQRPKDALFTQDFVKTLYERFLFSLQKQSKPDDDKIYQITREYRDVSKKTFGASSVIALGAMIQFVTIADLHEKYYEESLSTYEELLHLSKNNSNSALATLISTTTLKQRLSQLVGRIALGAHTHNKATLEKCLPISSEAHNESKKEWGSSHEVSLTRLREFCYLHRKIGTQESHAVVVRALLDAAVSIVTTETSTSELYESAKQLGQLFIDCKLSEHGMEVLHGLWGQIVAPEINTENKFDIKVDPTIGRQSYVFLVAFKEALDTQKKPYSEIMTSILVERMLYQHFIVSVKGTNPKKALVDAGRLRSFYLGLKQTVQATKVEDWSFKLFLKEWDPTMKTRKEISFMLYTGILEEICTEGRDISVGTAASITINRKLKILLSQQKLKEAYELAHFGFDIIKKEKTFSNPENIGYGFKLSSYLAGREGLQRSPQTESSEKLLELSRNVIREVIAACKAAKIDLVALKLPELEELIGLLGDQHNYSDLEWLFSALWSSREARKDWSYATIMHIGRGLVCARFSVGDALHEASAIRLAEDICYNVRRVWGGLDATTVSLHILLASLYNSTGRYQEAMNIYEDILRLELASGDDDHDGVSTDPNPVMTIRTLLRLLRNSYAHAGGVNIRTEKDYAMLLHELAHKFSLEKTDTIPVDKWSKTADGGSYDCGYIAPETWDFKGVKFVENERARSHPVERSIETWGRQPAYGISAS